MVRKSIVSHRSCWYGPTSSTWPRTTRRGC